MIVILDVGELSSNYKLPSFNLVFPMALYIRDSGRKKDSHNSKYHAR